MQPVSAYQATTISGGVGTTVIKNKGAVLKRIVIPGTYVGSITFHNAPSASGTTATSPILTLGLPTTSIPQSLECDIWCRNGLVYEATGTPVMTVVWN